MDARNYRVIRLDVIRDNFLKIRATVPPETGTIAVVKADAYGHGAVETARTVLECGADMLAVACVKEGAELRRAGIMAPILVLGAVTEDDVRMGVRYCLTQTVCSPEMVLLCREAAREEGTDCEVHLKIDSGMGRIGARKPEEVTAIMKALEDCPEVRLTGAFTHFADADGETDGYTRGQYARFMELTRDLPAGVKRHCANSAAIHRYPEVRLDLVRIGISLYGYPPVETEVALKPAMEWHAAVSYVKTLEAGDKVSYGLTWTAERETRVATVTCGYGDGYHRAGSGRAQVLIRGRRAPVIGRVCMDQMMVDVTGIPEVCPGDDVILLGESNGESITAEDLASAAGTISYEILLAATGRVHRIWTTGGEQ